MPRVSIIIIFLDAARYLGEAIESVYAQTLSDWELILVDDGSTDGSSAIARGIVDSDPARVSYLEHDKHDNRGMSASRNAGLHAATGEFVAFLDADDIWLPNNLEHQVRLLDAHPEAHALYGPTLLWYGWTGDPADAALDRIGNVGLTRDRLVQPPELLRLRLRSLGATTPAMCSLLVRHSALVSIGFFEERFRDCYEDQVYLSKIFARHPVFVTTEATSCYRQHDASCCRLAQSSGQYHPVLPHPAGRRFLDWLRDWLVSERLDDPDTMAALAYCRRSYDHPVRHGFPLRLAHGLRVGRRAIRQATRKLTVIPWRRWRAGHRSRE